MRQRQAGKGSRREQATSRGRACATQAGCGRMCSAYARATQHGPLRSPLTLAWPRSAIGGDDMTSRTVACGCGPSRSRQLVRKTHKRGRQHAHARRTPALPLLTPGFCRSLRDTTPISRFASSTTHTPDTCGASSNGVPAFVKGRLSSLAGRSMLAAGASAAQRPAPARRAPS